MEEKNIFELFKKICDSHPERVAYRFKKHGQWHSLTWQEHFDACKRISKSLMALGVQKGDKVNILSQTRLEWVQCDFATENIGSVTVGIYPSNLADDCAYIINHSEAVLLIVENQEQLDKIQSVRQQLQNLKHIVIFDAPASLPDGVITWDEFLARGDGVSDDEFYQRTQSVESDDLASIVYTSGTTGVPKGAMLTHGNFLFTSWSVLECLHIEEHFETLLFLPLAHVFARIIVFTSMRAGFTLAFAESIEKVAENLREVRPHFFASVPRIYEKVYERITSQVADAGGVKQKLFNWALEVGTRVSELKEKRQPVPAGLAMEYKLADKLVFHKIREALGGRVVFTISGAAPLNVTIARFFHACGILILEGLGMTENTSFTNVNRFEHYKFGTVGPPGPGIEQKIADDGEILFRGPNVMKGYYKNPEATKETIDKDGWLYTGDIGEIDEDNFLRVTDRKKDLIITAGGKNIAPQRVERIIRTSRYISQVVAYGDQKKFLVALITLDRPQVETWATKEGIEFSSWEELTQHPKVRALIEKEVEERNKQLASFETIKRFAILPEDFSIESGELTPTLKLKRKVITERYKDKIEALYAEAEATA